MKLWMFLPLLCLSLMILPFTEASYVEYNWTNIPYQYVSDADASSFDLETGTFSVTNITGSTNITTDQDLTIYHQPLGGHSGYWLYSGITDNRIAQIYGSLSANCSDVDFPEALGFTDSQDWYPESNEIYNNTVLCIKQANGNFSIIKFTAFDTTGNLINFTSFTGTSFTFPQTLARANSTTMNMTSADFTKTYTIIDFSSNLTQVFNRALSLAQVLNNPRYNIYITPTGSSVNPYNFVGIFNSTTIENVDCWLKWSEGAVSQQGGFSSSWNPSNVYCIYDIARNRMWKAQFSLPTNQAIFVTEEPPLYFISGIVQAQNIEKLYFDFDSGIASFTYISGADFVYDGGTVNNTKNDLIPYAPASWLKTDGSPDNNLNTANCGFLWDYTNTTQPYNPNINGYDTYCFRLASGRFGAIKIVNNTNVRGGNGTDFDFYWAVYREDYNSFQIVSQNPSPAQLNVSLDIYYTSSIPLNTEGKIRKIIGNSYSPFAKFNGTAALALAHTLTIPAYYINDEATYEFCPTGTSSSGINYSALPNKDCYQFQTGFANITSPFSGVDFADALIILPLDGHGFSIAVDCNFISPDNQSTGFNPPNYNYFVPSRNETVWANILHLGQSEIGTTWRVQCQDTGRTNYDAFILIDGYPKIVYALMNQSDTCILVQNTTNELSCVNSVNGSTPAWYCSYDANSCAATTGDVCSRWGRWYGFDCDSCGAIPSGFICNSSSSIFRNASSSPTDAICVGLNGILNVNCNSALSFVALIITMILTAVVGILSKSGVIGGIIFETSLITFFFIGWLPIWVALVLGVIAALLVAKFISDSIMPQAR